MCYKQKSRANKLQENHQRVAYSDSEPSNINNVIADEVKKQIRILLNNVRLVYELKITTEKTT